MKTDIILIITFIAVWWLIFKYGVATEKNNVLTFARNVFDDLCDTDKVRCIYTMESKKTLCINKEELMTKKKLSSIIIEGGYVLKYRYNRLSVDSVDIQVIVTDNNNKNNVIYDTSTVIKA